MPEFESEMEALRPLIGEWSGGGHGKFPTIDSFRYTETMRFYWNGIEPMLQFEQRTWKVVGEDPKSEPLHWEAGFCRALPAFGIELTNAQNGERVEVMRGKIEPGDQGVVLVMDSTFHGNDERLSRTRRRYELAGDTLRYQIWMATTRVADLTLHLEARLAREPSKM